MPGGKHGRSSTDRYPWRKGQQQAKSPTEARDSLRSTNLAKLLIAVGEGEFDGVPTDYDIYLDNTPIRDASGNYNFPNVKWDWASASSRL
jgi:predicted phage tail protein